MQRVYKTKICRKCGQNFIPRSSTDIQCETCRTHICVECKKLLIVKNARVSDSAKFCSKKCLIKGRQTKVNHVCEKCGKSFISASANSKWCDECRTLVCPICNTKFKVKPRRTTISKYCSRECRRKADMNYVWKDQDLEFIKHNYPFSLSMKELAKKYDTSVSAIARITKKLNLPRCPIEIRQKRVGDTQIYWTSERIIEKIKNYLKNGESINSANIQKINPSLHNCACKRFGSWKLAVESAGFDYREINLHSNRVTWTKGMILEKIRELHDNKVDLMASYVRDNYTSLFIAVRREKELGSWEVAINTAGFSYEEICGKRWGQKYQGKDGNLYFSIIEGKVGDILFDLVMKNEIINYETQVRVHKKRNWTCDFVVEVSLNKKIWLEVDGLENSRKDGPYNLSNEKILFYQKNGYNYCVVNNPDQVVSKINLTL